MIPPDAKVWLMFHGWMFGEGLPHDHGNLWAQRVGRGVGWTPDYRALEIELELQGVDPEKVPWKV